MTAIPHIERLTNGAAHKPARVDFCVDTLGPCVLFMPVTSEAETWVLTGGLQASTQFLGVYLLEPAAADTTIRKLLAEGFRVRMDGKVVSI